MSLRNVVIVTASLAAIGCTGVLEPRGAGGGGGPDASVGPQPDAAVGDSPNARFLNTVRDRLNAKCTPCHVEGGTDPDFLTVSADDYYDRIMLDYPSTLVGLNAEDSRIYAKGVTPHAGSVVWAQDDLDAVAAWIEDEYSYRNNQGGGDPPVVSPDPVEDCGGLDPAACALERFGTCFHYNEWSTYNVAAIANVQSSQGACISCHTDGRGGFYVSDNSQEMYTRWKSAPYVQKLVDAAINADGSFSGLIKTYRLRDKGSEPGHPSYQLPDETINDFVNATMGWYEAGGCVDQPPQ